MLSFSADPKYTLIPRIWNPEAERMSGYGLMLKTNMPAFGADGTLIDAKLLKVADGKLPVPQNLQAERLADNPSVVSVSWQNDPHTSAARLQDELMAVSYAEDRFSKGSPTGLHRSDLQGTFTLPLGSGPIPQAPSPTHLYLFMGSSDGEQYSASVSFEI